MRLAGSRAKRWPRQARAGLRTVSGYRLSRVVRLVSGKPIRQSSRHPSALFACIYRAKNAEYAGQLVREAEANGWEIRLWALDDCHPSFERFTVGTGAGSRLDLLNRLLDQAVPDAPDWIVMADDDVQVIDGSLSLFVSLADAADLALAQPAHHETSFRSFDLNLRAPVSVARLTTYVEQCPLLAINARWGPKFLPFPEDFGMGWGIELLWADMLEDGVRLGVVDWVTIRHMAPAGRSYNTRAEERRLRRLLDERNLTTVRSMQRTLAVWRPWRPAAPWVKAASRG